MHEMVSARRINCKQKISAEFRNEREREMNEQLTDNSSNDERKQQEKCTQNIPKLHILVK